MMCGRFTLTADQATIETYLEENFNITSPGFHHEPRYNIAPAQPIITLIDDGSNFRAGKLLWGHQGGAHSSKLFINARSETVHEKKTFKQSFLTRRCVVLADGFYEWDASKTPFHIHPSGHTIFAFAAIYSSSKLSEGSQVALLTKASDGDMATVHSRMPIMLDIKGAKAYMTRHASMRELQETLTHALAPKHFTPVHPMVGNPANDSAAIFSENLFSHY